MKTFGHTGDYGDLVFSLPTIRELGGGKLILYPREGTREPMTRARAENIIPLLQLQPYLEEVVWEDGRQPAADYEFWPFRHNYRPNVSLAELQAELFGVSPDLRQPWLTVPALEEKLDLVVFNRSFRYRNREFNWLEAVEKLGHKAVFIGAPAEYEDFVSRFGGITYYPTRNLLDAARLIASSRAFIGNQSCCNAIAEGLKVKKLLERNPGNCDTLFPE